MAPVRSDPDKFTFVIFLLLKLALERFVFLIITPVRSSGIYLIISLIFEPEKSTSLRSASEKSTSLEYESFIINFAPVKFAPVRIAF